MLASLAVLVVTTAGALRELSSQSLVALGVAVAAAALGGIAFSWKRYFPRRG